jgi:adenine-specific DNA-methyltransferase
MTTTSPLQSIQTPNLLQEQLARLKAEFPDIFTNEGQLNPVELLRLTGQQGREHFDFQWWGKSQAKRNAFTPTTAALRYDEARSVNPDKAGGNAIIEGENLEVLKLLLCAYRGQVKCVYIDPPYNTGNDFVYKDNFKEGERAYWEQTGVTQDGVKMSTNTKSDGRYHSNWLNMIYPRLLVARQLLREDGVIFVSIDDNEVTHLRKVLDEVFGEECFVAIFPWRKRTAKTDVPFGVSQDYEWIVCYANAQFLAGLELERSYYRTPDFPDDGWRLSDLTTQRSSDERQNSAFPMVDPKTGKSYPFNPKRVWGVTKDSFNDYYKKGKIVFPDDYEFLNISIPAYRVFESEDKAKVLKKYGTETSVKAVSTMLPKEVGMTETGSKTINDIFGGKPFAFPKPHQLIKHLLTLIRSDDALIFDFFAGSGSTPHAVLELNAEDGGSRKVISVQIPESTDEKSEAHKAGYKKISDITIERVKRVIQGYGDNPQPMDAGFKVFTLQKSAFPRADFAPNPDATEADQLAALKAFIADKEASLFNMPSAEAVRDEVLLKCGFQLDVQLTPIAEVTANQLYRARDQQTPPREAIVCFDSHLDTTTLDWLCQQRGQRVIVLEAALDTTGKWNLHHQLGDGLVVF